MFRKNLVLVGIAILATLSLSAYGNSSKIANVALTATGNSTSTSTGGSAANPADVIAQTITFKAPSNQTVGTPLALVATASSGLPVSFASTTPSVCTVSGTTATFLASGICTIQATQAGNSTYAAAAPVSKNCAVAGQAQSLAFGTIAAQTVGKPLTLSATASSGLAVTFVSETPSICNVSGSTASFIAVGTCTMEAKQTGNSQWAAATAVLQSFTVNIGAQTITFKAPGNQTVGTPLTLVATSSSGLAVSFASQTASVCTVSGTTATFLASGTCTVQATQPGNANYTAATPVAKNFAVGGEPQTITFNNPGAQNVGTPLALAATASSGLAITFVSETYGTCTVSGSTATFIATGSCTIEAKQAGNSAWAAATPVLQSFTVSGKTQTISFANPGVQTVGTPLTLSATASSNLAVSFASTTTGICTVSNTTATFIATGSCTIQATQAGNTTWAAATPVSQSFTVNQAQTITFGAIAAQTVGKPLTLSATASSGLPVAFASTTTGVCTVANTTATFIASGSCTIQATQTGNTTYGAATPVSQTFTVNGAAQTITFKAPATQTVGTPLALVATASSGLTVAFTSQTTGICTVSGTTATLIASGTCTVQATQPGNTIYAAATAVAKNFAVVGQAQSITFANPGVQTAGTQLALTATASSGLAITFVSETAGICTVSGTTASFIAIGSCTIEAKQAGNSQWAAATAVMQSFTVNIGAQTITFKAPSTQTVGTPLTLVATSNSGLAVSFASQTTSVCTVSGTTATFIASGTCTIQATQPGNASFAAATPVTKSFAVAGEPQTITFYNPGTQNVGTPLALAATASSGLPITFVSETYTTCTVSGSTATFIATGSCTIEAKQAGNSAWAAATPVMQSVTVDSTTQPTLIPFCAAGSTCPLGPGEVKSSYNNSIVASGGSGSGYNFTVVVGGAVTAVPNNNSQVQVADGIGFPAPVAAF